MQKTDRFCRLVFVPVRGANRCAAARSSPRVVTARKGYLKVSWKRVDEEQMFVTKMMGESSKTGEQESEYT